MADDILIRFRLVGSEANGLRRMALDEVRRPRDQIRYLLREELKARGLLPANTRQQTGGPESRTEDD